MASVRYVTSRGARIAWDAMGSGPDLVAVANFATNMDTVLSLSETREWFERLAESFRVVLFDQRGTGLSERGSVDHGLDVWIDDIQAVLDAADVEQAVLFAADFSVPVTIAFATAHPERVSRVVLYGGFARVVNGPGYDAGIPPEARDASLALVTDGWGRSDSAFARLGTPGDAPARDGEREIIARVQRLAASRNEVEAMVAAMYDLDVTGLLEQLDVPVLVLHREDDSLVPVAYSRYLAHHLPHAALHELPGSDHYMFFGDSERVIEEVESFAGVTRETRRGTTELAVVWFADIVSSTQAAAAAGNIGWRRRLDQFDALAEYHVARHGGRLVKHLGDGVLARFASARDAARCAIRFSEASAASGLEVRVGLDAGDVEIRTDDDISGIAVHLAQRVQSLAAPGEVLTTATVRHLLHGSQLVLVPRGIHELRGFDEPVELHAVESGRR